MADSCTEDPDIYVITESYCQELCMENKAATLTSSIPLTNFTPLLHLPSALDDRALSIVSERIGKV